MPQVLTTKAQILCPHLGKGTTIPSLPVWKVDDGYVLVEGDVGTLACPFLPFPCVGYRLKSMGLNATRIVGKKVILATDFNQTFTGLPLTIVETHETIDSTTTAPLPPAGPAPPLPPALLDMVKPVVTGSLSVSTFSVSSNQPATITATFTLVSAFPKAWVLTRISEPPPGANEDLTSGNLPGAVVSPQGGDWGASPLTVTLTLAAAYLSALGVGQHHFYMTGVSQRGLTGFTKVDLTVGT